MERPLDADAWTVAPATRVAGSVPLPGDKSISHRALILASLSAGTQEFEGLSTGQDVASTARILGQLGASITTEQGVTRVGPADPGGLAEPDDVLDCGNSGTSMRLLSGLLAGQPFLSVLTGDDSLRRRPMRRVAEPLGRMGALVDGRDGGSRAPLTIRGGGLRGITHVSEVASAQVKSCLMLAGLFATGRLEIDEPDRSRDHSERMLAASGVDLFAAGTAIRMDCGQTVRMPEGRFRVPADLSASAFFVVAGTILPNSELVLPGVGLNPTRSGYLEALTWVYKDEVEELGERRADIVVKPVFGKLDRPLHLSAGIIPRLIDEIPVLAILAARTAGVSRIRDAAELRAKESDRIKTTAAMLRAFGVQVQTYPDGMDITGDPDRPFTGGGIIDAHGDHRIAMAAAVGALAADAPTTITGVESVATSHPDFLPTLEACVER